MRTKHLLALLAGVALVGCVTEMEYEVNPQDEQTKIAFSSPVMYDNNVGTRANYHGEIGGHQYTDGGTVYSYPRTEDFQIYAVEHTGNFAGWAAATAAGFNNTAISYDPNLDGWAPKSNGLYYFWPGGEQKMSFAACSPADLDQAADWNGRAYAADGLTLTNFKVPANSAEQFDLMFSKRIVNQTSQNMGHSANYYSGIPIQFQHALSSIRFSISNTSAYTVVLTKITLYGVADTGTFKENLTEDQNDYGKYVIKTSPESTGNVAPAWNLGTNPTLTTSDQAYLAFQGNVTFMEAARYVSELAGDDDTVNQLLLLPQTLTESATVVIEYTVNGASAKKTVKLKDAKIVNRDENGANETVSNQTFGEWKMGTRYTYRLVYTEAAADQDKIYFAPSSDNWADAGIAVIDLAGAN